MDRRLPLIIACGGLLLVVVAYLPIASASWLFWEGATDAWMPGTPSHTAARVLPRWTAALTSSPAGTQLMNLVFHILVAGLTSALVASLGVGWTWAATAGVLLLVNPVAVETIRHGTGRADVLVGLGTVGACLASVHRRWMWMTGGLLVALFSKEAGVVSLLLVPLVVWAARVQVSRAQVVWYLLSLGAVGPLWIIHWVGGMPLSAIPIVESDPAAAVVSASAWGALQVTATLRLLTTAVVGTGMTPDFDYDIVARAWRIASVVALVGIGGLAWLVRSTWPVVSFGCVWVLIASAPRWVIQTPRGYYNEHQFYVALVGIVLIVVGLLSSPWTDGRRSPLSA